MDFSDEPFIQTFQITWAIMTVCWDHEMKWYHYIFTILLFLSSPGILILSAALVLLGQMLKGFKH